MTDSSEVITFSCPPGALVYIGAGAAQDLDQYLNLGLKRAILIEPNPDRVQALEELLGDTSHVDILQVAIGARTGRGTLHLYNQMDAASLRKPRFSSGLQIIGEIAVDIYQIDNLLSQLDLDANESNLLIIDTPGVEHVLMRDMKANGQIDLFEHIVLRTAPPSTYKGVPDLGTVLQILDETRFRLVDLDEDEDQATQVLLTRDAYPAQTHRRLSEQRAQLRAATVQFEELEAKLDKSQRLYAALQADLEALRKDYKTLHAAKTEQDMLLMDVAHSLRQFADKPKPASRQTKKGASQAAGNKRR